MPKDLCKLRPTELVRLVNSTPLGPVVDYALLHRHMNEAGYRIGDGRSVHLVRYVSWLAQRDAARERAMSEAAPTRAPAAYEAHKRRAGERQAAISAEGRDIGPLPRVEDPDRRARCRDDLRAFCETYFPRRFYLRWAGDHLKVIELIEAATARAQLFAVAMPRGSGKSALTEVAVLWGLLYGFHRMIAAIAATKDKAIELLDSIKTELENNDALAEDFPEVCYPIRCLEGLPNRCAGQLCEGRRTKIVWTKTKIILPTIEGSVSSGAIIKVGGLTGSDVRGMKHTRKDGFVVRPTLAILDDPQNDKTARSASANEARVRLLEGAVLGMAGPGRKLGAIMPCTVIYPDDMADRVLDRDRHPDWRGVRTKMVYRFPGNEKLWEEYARIRAEGLRSGDEGHAATAFYRKNRAAMDAGAEVAWPDHYEDDEISAIQHAMNLRLRNEETFFAEYQNEPIPQHVDVDFLTAKQICETLSGLARREIPTSCNHLTLYEDVHERLLYWMLCAWTDDFTGYVIDYGTWPDQKRRYFTMRTAVRTLRRSIQGAGREGAILGGLRSLNEELLGLELPRDDGATLRVAMCMVDSGWEADTVHQFVRTCDSPVVLPSKGLYLGASSQPWEQRKPKKGERQGHHWRIAPLPGKAKNRHVLIDTNWWKSFVQRRLTVASGDPGSLSLFGKLRADGRPAHANLHRMLAEQLTAEFRVSTEGRGRTLDEWRLPPSKPDNHLLDCLVGCAVGASMCGASLIGEQPATRTVRRRTRKVSYL